MFPARTTVIHSWTTERALAQSPFEEMEHGCAAMGHGDSPVVEVVKR